MVTQVVNTAQNLTRRVLYEHKTREDKNVSTNPGDLLSPLWSPNYTPTSRNVISPIRTTTAVYAGRLYDVTGSTKNRYVYAGDELVATIERVGTSTPTVRYVHTDHLGGTNVLTNASSTVVQTLDYYPFGSERINQDYGSQSQRTYIGEVYDTESELNYLNARYYDSSRGQFMSQDPTFLAIGSPELSDILARANGLPNTSFQYPGIEKAKDRAILQAFLSDPQLQNSYGYGRNNPLRYSDPTGEAIPLLAILAVYSAAQFAIDVYDAKTTFIDYPEVFSSEEKARTGFKLGLDALFFGAGKAAKDIGERAVLEVGPTILDVMDHFFGPQIYQSANYNQLRSQTSVQSRQEFVQSYNANMGYSTGGGGGAPSNNSLWTTPSGAVVTWGGNLVAGPTQ